MMTDNEIIKALECCTSKWTCDTNCPMWSVQHCGFELRKDALGLINRQKAEKETMQSYIDCLKAEIERLEGLVTDNFTDKIMIPMMIETAKAEAVKEFAERLHEYINGIIERHEMPMFPFSVAFVSGMETKIDNLVKEMVGERR